MASLIETKVLIEMLKEPEKKHYGNVLRKALDIPSGSLYPMLIRMEEKGYLTSAFEQNPRLKRGERHYYWFTPEGVDYARTLALELCADVCQAMAQWSEGEAP